MTYIRLKSLGTWTKPTGQHIKSRQFKLTKLGKAFLSGRLKDVRILPK